MTDPTHLDPNRHDRVSPAAVPPPPAPVADSLQGQIHAVQASRPAPAGRRRGTSKLVVGGALIAGIVALWQFGPRFGWGPGGRGPGNGQGGEQRLGVIDDTARTASSTQKPHAPQRPLRVEIDGTRYLVDGKEVDVAAISQLATQVPPGEGPAVEIKRNATSRVKAEQDLKAAIDKQNLPATWTPPLE